MTPPRVFISSVVDGFGAYRQAAAEGVRAAGMQPVLVNEEFPALASSPRNACLDGIESCDALILIIGERGGWMAPSGKLVVEEECEHAVRRMPVFVFLQESTRDQTATDLVRRVSDYTTGHFRSKFSTAEELRSAVRRSMEEAKGHLMLSLTDLPTAFASFSHVDSRQSSAPTIRLRVVPLRADELIDPVRMGEVGTHDELLILAMQPQISLYTPRESHEATTEGDEIVLVESDPRQHSGAAGRVAISGRGHITVETRVNRPARRGGADFGTGLVVALEQIEDQLSSAMRYCAAVYERFDPYQRHQQFGLNVALLHLGYATLERDPVPRASHTMRMGGDTALVAHDSPRTIHRNELSNPQSEVARAVALIERASRTGW